MFASLSRFNLTVSFVVPLYGNLSATKIMLSSLCETIPSWLCHEVVFVDDFSEDGTREWLVANQDENIRFINNESNLGYARSVNRGAKESVGKYLFIVNSDVVFQSGWFEPMLELLLNQEFNVGVVGNVQYKVIDKSVDHAGMTIDCEGKLVHIKEVDVSSDQLFRNVFAVTGACIGVSRSDFLDVGGFDEQYVNGCEDVDLCLKFRSVGKQICVSTQSRILHHVGLSRKCNSVQNEKNSRILYGKWRSELLDELAKTWKKRIKDGHDESLCGLDGELEVRSYPDLGVLSRVLSNHVLMKEERRWENVLDRADVNENIFESVSIFGLVVDKGGRRRVVERGFEVVVRGIASVRNFYICGVVFPIAYRQLINVSIDINGLHKKNFEISGGNFNLGIEYPFLQEDVNAIRVSFLPKSGFFKWWRWQRFGCFLDHLVLDDKVEPQLERNDAHLRR